MNKRIAEGKKVTKGNNKYLKERIEKRKQREKKNE